MSTRADGLHPLLALLLLLEQLALAGHVAAVALGGDVLAEALDGLAGDDLAADGALEGDLELVAHVGQTVVQHLVVEGTIALGGALEPVVEVEEHLGEWHLGGEFDPSHGQVGERGLFAPTLTTQFHDWPDIPIRHHDRRLDERLLHRFDGTGVGEVRGIVDPRDLPVGGGDPIAHGGRREQQREIVLSLQALLDDLQMQQTQEPAAIAESQRGR
jgi:hypothetical protein